MRIGVMTPWMLASENIRQILRNAELQSILSWFFVDEAHLFNEEDSVTLAHGLPGSQVHAPRLPSTTTWGAFTGTTSVAESRVISRGLCSCAGHFVDFRCSVDRPNLKYIIRFFDYLVSGYELFDLAWIIPFALQDPQHIPTTLIFYQTIDLGVRVMSLSLDELIPASIPNRLRLVKPCNAFFPQSYRRRFKTDMEEGRIRIGICAETCTYGVDTRNVRQVITFGEVSSFAKMKQDFCRAVAMAPLLPYTPMLRPRLVRYPKPRSSARRRETTRRGRDAERFSSRFRT